MNKLFLFLLIILLFSGCKNTQNEDTAINEIEDNSSTYYLIRHADKQRGPEAGEDPGLTEKGIRRAEFWAKELADVNFDAVYSTDFRRTRNTAKPIAEANNLEIRSYNPNDLFNESFQEETRGKTVLVVGHSNTTATLANKILGENQFEEINDSVFGNLFIIKVRNGEAKAELLDFNDQYLE